ncbi:type IX secretion system anionic LPS delivery protein PorZ [Flavobacterium macacae]|uniref:T9SS C-terminal target domain-containing protein n=1 Tax=Flavobacterium macacae TaxID=2488993 RepID=A0A3P3W717_9FLAO|nr:two-component regulator propeller domain-containing protein [Flavobacterium macacae]RRJ89766.1 T9SS C-terminal target domain-containing protein [Flavobacterium macacae]
MRKYFFFLLLISQMAFAQNNQLWKGYFSYNEVNDLTESPTRIIASTQKALFSKNLNINELKTTTTIDGLSGQDITSIYYSTNFNKTYIGHANGLMLIVNGSDGAIKIVPGIRDQNGITPTKKKINHFLEYENKLYISTDFGLVQFNLETQLFGDTYLLGNAGQELIVYQSAVLNNSIYAATDLGGIRSADLMNPNLNDFAQWSTFDPGSWKGIVNHNNQLVVLNSSNSVSRHNGSGFSLVLNLPQTGLDIRTFQNTLSITTNNHVYTFDQNLIQTSHIISTNIPDMVVNFNCATVIGNAIFIGTKENGVITASLSNPSTFEVLKPDGPSRNNIFSLKSTPTNKLWAVYGSYNIFYVPDYSNFGISKLSDTGWLNIPYEETLESQSLTRIALNPNDEKNVFFGSNHTGILEFQDDIAIAKYDHTTPNGPESVFLTEAPSFKSVRNNGLAFDRTGNLWFTNSLVDNAMKVRKADGSWQSFSIAESVQTTDQNYANLVIDKNSTKWFASENGLMGFNENTTPKFKKASSSDDAGNPFLNNVRTVAIDNNNRLWIGTLGGLRILPGVDRFLGEDDLETNSIIIMEDGLPQELLYEQTILDIAVDGANNKWIATGSSGAFLLSSNGQQTLYHFTRENSPLPSNSINDIEINSNTGEVFFATDAGLVSFKGTSTGASGDLSNVYVYPNPVRPEFTGTVKIAGLIDDANVKITDIEGNLVYETTSEGGTIEWDTKAFGKYRVASGVYMIFIASKDGLETKVKKVMIIR